MTAKSIVKNDVPADLRKVLAASSKLNAQWHALTDIGRRDFLRWITSAKKPETRQHRIDTLESRLASGKRRPCCFAVVPMQLYTALGANPKAKATWSTLTPDERRDFVDWIEDVSEKDTKARRVERIIATLATGKRKP